MVVEETPHKKPRLERACQLNVFCNERCLFPRATLPSHWARPEPAGLGEGDWRLGVTCDLDVLIRCNLGGVLVDYAGIGCEGQEVRRGEIG